MRECINFRDEFGNLCLSDLVTTEPCNEHPCSSWTEWTEWTDCSVSCGGGGTRRKARECLANRRHLCQGQSEATEACGEERCPSLTEWTEWTQCSRSAITPKTSTLFVEHAKISYTTAWQVKIL